MKTALMTTVLALAVAAPPAYADKVTEAMEKAEKQRSEGKTEDAIKTLDKVRKDFPTDPRVYAALAEMHERSGIDASKYDESRRALDEGVSATAGAGAAHADVLAHRAAFELRAGSGAKALEFSQRAVAAQETPLALAVHALAETRAGNLAQALEAAKKAVAAAPQNAAAQLALGEALLASGQPKEAEAALRKGVQADGQSAEIQAALARALLEQGRGSEAVAAARQATMVDDTSAIAYATLGLALLEAEKNWNEAIAQAQQGKFLNPRNAFALVAVAKIFSAAQNHQQAQLAYAEALRVDPDYAPARLSQIDVKIARGDLEGAEADVAAVVKAEPNNAEANLLLCQIRVRAGRHAAAIDACRKAAEAMAGNDEVQALLGGTLFYAGQPAEAAEAFGRAVQLAPDNLRYRKDYGFTLGLAGKPDEGLKQLSEVIATPGYDDPAGYLAVGELSLDVDPKQPDKAIAAYTKALELDPKNVRGALGLGSARYAKKDFDGAIAALQNAIQIEPKVTGAAASQIGWCYLGKRDVDQARTWAQKAAANGVKDETLAKSIDEYAKAVADGIAKSEEEIARWERENQRNAQIAQLVDQYNKGDDAARARAVRQLADVAGAESYDYLLIAVSNDKDPRVKGAACYGLGRIGAAGKKALPYVRQVVELQPPTILEDDQIEYWSLMFEAQSTCRETLRKLQ